MTHAEEDKEASWQQPNVIVERQSASAHLGR
jgi:hypothetical protein